MDDDTYKEQDSECLATQCSEYRYTLKRSTGTTTSCTRNTQKASWASSPTPALCSEQLQMKMWSTAKCPAFQFILSHAKWHHTAASTALTAPRAVSTVLSRVISSWFWLQLNKENSLALGIQVNSTICFNRNWCGEEEDRSSWWKTNNILGTSQLLLF